MEKNLLGIKAAVTAFFTALGSFLGWQGIMALVWVAAMLLDYISGSAAAIKEGQWSSATARNGLWHKGGMVLVVLVAAAADIVLSIIVSYIPAVQISWPYVLLPLVLAWYILTEFGSILENAVKLGAPVPQWLTKALKVSVAMLDKTGAQASAGEEKTE